MSETSETSWQSEKLMHRFRNVARTIFVAKHSDRSSVLIQFQNSHRQTEELHTAAQTAWYLRDFTVKLIQNKKGSMHQNLFFSVRQKDSREGGKWHFNFAGVLGSLRFISPSIVFREKTRLRERKRWWIVEIVSCSIIHVLDPSFTQKHFNSMERDGIRSVARRWWIAPERKLRVSSAISFTCRLLCERRERNPQRGTKG